MIQYGVTKPLSKAKRVLWYLLRQYKRQEVVHLDKKKQASKFNKESLKGREHWLKYLPEEGMVCSLCRKYNKHLFSRSIWNTVPCTRRRQQSITAHEACAAHKDAVKLESEKLNFIFISYLYAILIT